MTDRFSIRGIIGGLMVADNLGDVHDEVNFLCDLAGVPRPEGNFEEGWTDRDWANVRAATIRETQRELIRDFLTRHAGVFNGARVLDYGCGLQPYRDIVEHDSLGECREYVGWNRGKFPGGSTLDVGPDGPLSYGWDVILCTQVLQYVHEPGRLVDAFRGALTPRGALVLTYATNWPEVEPEDLHRFTRTGAERLLHRWEIAAHERLGEVPFGDREQLPLGGGLVAYQL